MAIIEPGQEFRPPPLAGPEVPVAQRVEALQRRVAFEQRRAEALQQPERVQRLERLQQAIMVPPERELIIPEEELDRIERIAEIEEVPPLPSRIPEELRRRRPVVPTPTPLITPEPLDVVRAPLPETVTREEAVRRLQEFAPELQEDVAQRLVERGPEAVEQFVEAQLREERPEIRFGVAGRLQQLEEAGEFVGIPRTREEAAPITETLREFALDITPIVGTERIVSDVRENFDQLSPADKAFGIGLIGVSALGDATLVAGPIKVSLKLLKGSPGQKSKIAQTLVTSEADEAADLLRSTVGRRADAADQVRAIVRELDELDKELTELRAPLGETQVETFAAKRNIRQAIEAEDVPTAIDKALGSLERVKRTPIIQQREQDLAKITSIQERLGGLTDDLISGQKTPVEFRVSSSTSTDELEEAFTRIVDTPGSLRGTERVIVESPATREGVRDLIKTDDVLQRIRVGRSVAPEEIEEFTRLQSRLQELKENTTIIGPRGVPQTSEPALQRLREFEETALPRIRELRQKTEVQELLDKKLASELVLERGVPATALRQSESELRGVVSSSVINDIERLVTSKNPVRDSQRILDDLARQRSMAAERGPKELQAVQKAEREVRTFAEQQQEAVRLANEIADSLQSANVRKIGLRSIVREGSSEDINSLAEFLVRERKEGNLTDIKNLIRTKQARGEDITDLLERQAQVESRIQEEVSRLSQTFSTQDPEASLRFADLLQDALERRNISTVTEVERIGSATRPLTQTEITELTNLTSRLEELREASRTVNAAALKFSDLSPNEALRIARQELIEFERANLPRIRELRARPQVEITPDVRSIKLEPEPPRGMPTQPTGPGLFGPREGPPRPGGPGVGGPPRRPGGIAVLEGPVEAIPLSGGIGRVGPRLEVVTTLRSLRQPRTFIPILAPLPFGTVEAPERPAVIPTIEPDISPNGVPVPKPDRGPRRVPSPRRTEPEIEPSPEPVPERPPEREAPPLTEPVVAPIPEDVPEPGIPPGFTPIPTPAAVPGTRIVPSPLDLPLIDVEPELGRAVPDLEPEIFPEIKTGIDESQERPTRREAPPREVPRPIITPRPIERITPTPRITITPRPTPEFEPEFQFEPDREPFERVEPIPEIVPEELPEPFPPPIPPRPRVTVPVRPPTRPRRIPPRLAEPEGVRELRRPGRPRAQGVAWRQGEIWVSIFPPFGENEIFHTRSPLPNTRRVRNPRQAFRFIEQRAGGPPAETFDEWASWFSSASPQITEPPVF